MTIEQKIHNALKVTGTVIVSGGEAIPFEEGAKIVYAKDVTLTDKAIGVKEASIDLHTAVDIAWENGLDYDK